MEKKLSKYERRKPISALSEIFMRTRKNTNINAKSAEGPKYARITDKNLDAKSAAGPKYALITGKKNHCKKCSDPIKISIKQWIFNSRQYDKMRNIYDADRFIDKCFLEGLVEDYKQCYYGDCQDAVGLRPSQPPIYRISK